MPVEAGCGAGAGADCGADTGAEVDEGGGVEGDTVDALGGGSVVEPLTEPPPRGAAGPGSIKPVLTESLLSVMVWRATTFRSLKTMTSSFFRTS